MASLSFPDRRSFAKHPQFRIRQSGQKYLAHIKNSYSFFRGSSVKGWVCFDSFEQCLFEPNGTPAMSYLGPFPTYLKWPWTTLSPGRSFGRHADENELRIREKC